jgi:hypothetical protein
MNLPKASYTRLGDYDSDGISSSNGVEASFLWLALLPLAGAIVNAISNR